MIVPTMIYPLNIEPIKESVLKTKKILIVEDDVSFSSLGSEIISQLSTQNLKFNCVKLNTLEDIIPSSKILEEKHYVSKENIYNSIMEMFSLWI